METLIQTNKTPSYKAVICNKEYMKFIIAKFISRFGDSIDTVAYGWLVFQLTGSVAMLATLYAVNGIPSFLFNMISGTIVGYFPKKRIIYLCDFSRGLSVLLTAILAILGLLRPWHLFVFTIMNSTFEAFRSPCEPALLKRIITKETYDYAISIDSTGTTIVELIGYSIAGFLINFLTVGGVILIDAITFFICGLLICLVKSEKETIIKNKITLKNYSSDFKEGFLYVIKDKFILIICLFAGLFNLFLIPFNSMQPAYASLILKQGPEVISIMSVSFLLAMILGSLIAPILKNKLSVRTMFLMAGFNISLSYFGFSQLGRVNHQVIMYALLIILSVFMGASVPLLNIPIRVSLMSRVSDEYITRTISFVNALALCCTPIGGAIVGALSSFLSLSTIYLVFSILLLLLFISQVFNKSLGNINSTRN